MITKKTETLGDVEEKEGKEGRRERRLGKKRKDVISKKKIYPIYKIVPITVFMG